MKGVKQTSPMDMLGLAPSEREFETALADELRDAGALVFNVSSSARQRRQATSWPDLQVYHHVWTGHLELKVGDSDQHKAKRERAGQQRRRIVEIMTRGTSAYILRLKKGRLRIETVTGRGEGTIQLSIFTWRDARDLLERLKRCDRP